MKKLANILLLAVALLTGACEGPMGPQGIPGEDGYNFVGTTFQFTGNFTTANYYQLEFNFQNNGFTPLESDVILAYILWTSEDGSDYWRPLPQTTYFDSGAILQYNFNFKANIEDNRIIKMAVFMEGDIDLSTVPDEYTLSQTFRAVVVPSDFLSQANVDINDLNSILNSPAIQLKSLDKVDLKTAPDINLELK